MEGERFTVQARGKGYQVPLGGVSPTPHTTGHYRGGWSKWPRSPEKSEADKI